MSFLEDQLAQLSRQPAWVLKLYPDYCANEFGVAPCAATGATCYFTYPTCKDKTHYIKTTKEYRFCEKAGPQFTDMLPYIKSISYNSMELDPKSMKTSRANLTISLYDDLPHYFANADKQNSNIESAGSFWKNWLARNPNYFRRLAELHLCFGHDPLLASQILAGGGSSSEYPDGRIGQTFLSNGEWLEGITIKAALGGNLSSCQFALELYTTSSGLPSSLLMTSQTMTFVEPNPSPNGTIREFYIPMQYQMPAGTLAFAVKPVNSNAGSLFIQHSTDLYSGGTYIYRDNFSPYSWHITSGWDLYFKIYTLPWESKLYFRGVMEKIEQKQDEVALTIKDLLKSLDADSHTKQSDKVTANMKYQSETYFVIQGGDELPPYGVILASGGKYIKYSGITGPDTYNNWCLYNVQFAFGSSGSIEVGETLQYALVYGRDNYGLADGLTADMILLDLLCNRAGIEPQYIAAVDSGATLVGDISSSDITITLSDGSLVPDQGVIKIDDEFIVYGSRDGNVLYVSGGASIPLFYYHHRGAFGTAAASHLSGAKIYLSTITRECLTWLNNCLYRANISDPVKTQDLVNQVCEQALVQAWENEAGEIEFKEIAPPIPADAVDTLTDEEHFVENSINVVDDPALQNTRIVVFYNPIEANPGDDPDKYQNLLDELDADVESANYLNTQKPKLVYANWVYRSDEAVALASRLLALTRDGALQAEFKLELKDIDIEVGNFIKIDSKQIVDSSGANKTACFEIISKKPNAIGRYEFEAMMYNFAGLFGLVGPENPTLKISIGNFETTIELQLADDTYLDTHFKDAGQIRIEDEKISYAAKSYNAGTMTLTLTGCTRGILGTTSAPHNAGADVLLLFAGASNLARDRWAWVGDAENKIDGDGDGIGETQGYVIW